MQNIKNCFIYFAYILYNIMPAKTGYNPGIRDFFVIYRYSADKLE